MAFNLVNQEKSDSQRELEFLRHLAFRAATDGGKYLTHWDIKALEKLSNAHDQDTAETSVLEFALNEYYDLNPHKRKVS